MQYITEIIIGVLALIGTLGGSYLSHRRSTAIIAYRLEQLEKKVDKHNKFAERMPVVEEQMKVVNHRLEDLERKGEG
jgi:hypothetical protein